MKFIRARKNEEGGGRFRFHLSPRDRNLLLSLLKMFPATDPRIHRLSGTDRPEIKASQELLVEAMEEQRSGHAAKIEALLKNPERFFRGDGDPLELVLDAEQMEWLLQALNDIRVGSWMRLGCPEMGEARRRAVNEESAAHYTAMQISGIFQSALLEAFRGS